MTQSAVRLNEVEAHSIIN